MNIVVLKVINLLLQNKRSKKSKVSQSIARYSLFTSYLINCFPYFITFIDSGTSLLP